MRKMRFKLIGGLMVMVMVFFGGTLTAFAAEVPETHEALAVHGPQCTHEACGHGTEEGIELLRGVWCPSCPYGELLQYNNKSGDPYGKPKYSPCAHGYPLGTDTILLQDYMRQSRCNRCNYATTPTYYTVEVVYACGGHHWK